MLSRIEPGDWGLSSAARRGVRGLVSTSVQLCHVRQCEQARRGYNAVGQLVIMPLRGLHVTALDHSLMGRHQQRRPRGETTRVVLAGMQAEHGKGQVALARVVGSWNRSG